MEKSHDVDVKTCVFPWVHVPIFGNLKLDLVNFKEFVIYEAAEVEAGNLSYCCKTYVAHDYLEGLWHAA